ncbi:MAG: hypothetical protein AAB533_01975 [Patescibacteria group bacterium]
MAEDRISFFQKHLGDGRLRGQITIETLDARALQEIYGIRGIKNIAPGTILQQVDYPEEPPEKVIGILQGDLKRAWEAMRELENSLFTDEQGVINFFLELLDQLHQLYIQEGVR